MKIVSSVLFFILFTAALGQSSDSTSTVTSQSTSSASTTEVTTISDKTTPTTLESTTITVESTTTSVASTTIAPTTSSTSTTASSSTSDTPIPTSSPVPSTTSPGPTKCEFNVTEGSSTCIRAELQAKFIIYAENTTYDIMLGCNASYAGSDCSSSNETQTLVLSESTYTLTMIFEKKSGKVVVNNVTFQYNMPGLPSGSGSNHSEDLFNVKVGNSYKCKSKFDIHLDNITMEVQEVHIQAFIEEGKGYGAIEECDADEKVSDIVPIAVGVALAALIIIVLIAYLVGRRRSRQKGYQSV